MKTHVEKIRVIRYDVIGFEIQIRSDAYSYGFMRHFPIPRKYYFIIIVKNLFRFIWVWFFFPQKKKQRTHNRLVVGKKNARRTLLRNRFLSIQWFFFFWSIKSTGKFRFLIRSPTVYSYFFFLEKFRFGEKKSDYKCN